MHYALAVLDVDALPELGLNVGAPFELGDVAESDGKLGGTVERDPLMVAGALGSFDNID